MRDVRTTGADTTIPVVNGTLISAPLDAGWATGEHAILAALHGARAVGIDVSPRAIEVTRCKSAERGIKITFRVLDELDLDTLGESFDAVIRLAD
jgi:2-polyprenyl-3-methyl-5-hydroxy-6-metoxy-1,4-benzoquinol methylase